MANWVRFADTKATILAAALGVTLTVFMTNAGTAVKAIKLGCPGGVAVAVLAVLALCALCYTLGFLMRAIAPRRTTRMSGINRFAWPTLSGLRVDDILVHVESQDAGKEVWQQVVDLAAIADAKFGACNRAIHGFTAFAALAIACIAMAVALTS